MIINYKDLASVLSTLSSLLNDDEAKSFRSVYNALCGKIILRNDQQLNYQLMNVPKYSHSINKYLLTDKYDIIIQTKNINIIGSYTLQKYYLWHKNPENDYIFNALNPCTNAGNQLSRIGMIGIISLYILYSNERNREIIHSESIQLLSALDSLNIKDKIIIICIIIRVLESILLNFSSSINLAPFDFSFLL